MTECALHEHGPGERPTLPGSEPISMHSADRGRSPILRDDRGGAGTDGITPAVGISRCRLHARSAAAMTGDAAKHSASWRGAGQVLPVRIIENLVAGIGVRS